TLTSAAPYYLAVAEDAPRAAPARMPGIAFGSDAAAIVRALMCLHQLPFLTVGQSHAPALDNYKAGSNPQTSKDVHLSAHRPLSILLTNSRVVARIFPRCPELAYPCPEPLS